MAIKGAVGKGLLILLSLLLMSLTSVTTQAQSGNLLINGDFEGEFNPVPSGWHYFWWGDGSIAQESLPMPRFALERTVVMKGGSQSWRVDSAIPMMVGIYQRVPITPETVVNLSAYTTAVADGETWVRQQIGIDPTGGSDPSSPLILWSEQAQYVNGEWGQLDIVGQAGSATEYVTIYLATSPDLPLPYTAYFDEAVLEIISHPIRQLSPLPTPTADPLLNGFIVEQGVAPGEQGCFENCPSTTTGMPTDGQQESPSKDWRDWFLLWLLGALLIFLLGVSVGHRLGSANERKRLGRSLLQFTGLDEG